MVNIIVSPVCEQQPLLQGATGTADTESAASVTFLLHNQQKDMPNHHGIAVLLQCSDCWPALCTQ
jgi:hypothetical protein